ncbi:MAG: LysR substrate-binding domain-containing protein [Gammaproteobacteria bacterium]
MPGLEQLRTLLLLARNDFSVTETARALGTSQPSISRRLQNIEEELGVALLQRRGKQIQGFTHIGQQIAAHAFLVVQHLEEMVQLASGADTDNAGELNIATTHTQARYALPFVVADFVQRYPKVRLQIHQASPEQMGTMIRNGSVDFAIATDAFENFEDLVVLPCYRWRRCLVVPQSHALARQSQGSGQLDSLQLLAQERIITYSFGLWGEQGLYSLFRRHDFRPQIAITATDAEVIKSYVRSELGLGLVARMAVSAEQDQDLCPVGLDDFLPHQTTGIVLSKEKYLRPAVTCFIHMFAQHLTAELVQQAQRCSSHRKVRELFADLAMEVR